MTHRSDEERTEATPEPDEHARYAAYLDDLAHVSEDHEAALVARVLSDADRVMAGAAVVRHCDRRAADLLGSARFDEWTRRMAELVGLVGRHPFVVRRLREWSLFDDLVTGGHGDGSALLAASNWLQLKVAASTVPRDVLSLLAEGGRTRRIRGMARTSLASGS